MLLHLVLGHSRRGENVMLHPLGSPALASTFESSGEVFLFMCLNITLTLKLGGVAHCVEIRNTGDQSWMKRRSRPAGRRDSRVCYAGRSRTLTNYNGQSDGRGVAHAKTVELGLMFK